MKLFACLAALLVKIALTNLAKVSCNQIVVQVFVRFLSIDVSNRGLDSGIIKLSYYVLT